MKGESAPDLHCCQKAQPLGQTGGSLSSSLDFQLCQSDQVRRDPSPLFEVSLIMEGRGCQDEVGKNLKEPDSHCSLVLGIPTPPSTLWQRALEVPEGLSQAPGAGLLLWGVRRDGACGMLGLACGLGLSTGPPWGLSVFDDNFLQVHLGSVQSRVDGLSPSGARVVRKGGWERAHG